MVVVPLAGMLSNPIRMFSTTGSRTIPSQRPSPRSASATGGNSLSPGPIPRTTTATGLPSTSTETSTDSPSLIEVAVAVASANGADRGRAIKRAATVANITGSVTGSDCNEAETTDTMPVMEGRTLSRFAYLAIAAVAATSMSFALPEIALDTSLADLVVRFTDTAAIEGLPWLLVVALLIVVSRPGVSTRRRLMETGTLVVAMLIVAVSITVLNEHGLKPAFASARPNIEALAESGALGPEFPDGEALYEVGDKDDRREVLRRLLPNINAPSLSHSVRDHWAHETGYSFPSGHAISAATFASAIAVLGLFWLQGWRRQLAMVVLPIWAVLIAYSRVLLDVHRPIDVVAGATIGLLLGTAAGATIRSVTNRLDPS